MSKACAVITNRSEAIDASARTTTVSSPARRARRLPIGAELTEEGAHIRIWAPHAARVDVVHRGVDMPLTREDDGYWSALLSGMRAGARYRVRLDGAETLYPDPASRFQPDGPHGESEVVDPAAFPWTDGAWRGVALAGQVIYEMHVGTFTAEGTWAAAMRELPALRRLGVTVLEMMPVAEFSGRFGWGYDGVDLYAPTRLYGRPDDLRRFVDRAHAEGLGVILDVVYNHLGPDGNYLKPFAPEYFSRRYENEWGEALNFDGEGADAVREFFVGNAGYWIDEFHFDGLRLDATQQIFDASPEHVIAAITRRVREAARGRATIVVAENEPQDVRGLRAVEEGGFGLDAQWNDDFHHAARVAATGSRPAYYSDFRGTPQEFISTVRSGFLYQGQPSAWQGKRRGTPTAGFSAARFVTFLQNHDQVANSARGERLHQLTSPGRHRALTALLLLAPATPMLFQGQEFSASAPFLYFADHAGELARLVRAGRVEFLSQFPGIATPEGRACLPDPAGLDSFARCKVDHGERERHPEALALHHDLLALRRADPAFAAQRADEIAGAVLDAAAFVLRFSGGGQGDRLLVVNLGPDLELDVIPEPLLAPPAGERWTLVWSSEHPRYGGCGTPAPDAITPWRVAAESAVVLAPAGREDLG
jgi:maltooligosyltrehalose trehalohydrolase